MKFKLDENLPGRVGEALIARGLDAHTVSDEGLSGAHDDVVLRACLAEGKILVTLDLDFAEFRACPPGAHPGIWVLRPPKQTFSEVEALVLAGLRLAATEPAQGLLWVIDEQRVRIRDGRA